MRIRITPEEERELICHAQKKSKQALDHLVALHMPMVRLLAVRLCESSFDLDELSQAGIVGLIRAIMKYDYDSSVKLITYAVPWIIGEMRCARRSAQTCADYSFQDEKCPGITLEETLGQEDQQLSFVDLRLAIDQLEEEARLLIYLRYFRDNTQKNTAILLGKSQSQISKLEQRTLAQLKALLC